MGPSPSPVALHLLWVVTARLNQRAGHPVAVQRAGELVVMGENPPIWCQSMSKRSSERLIGFPWESAATC